MFKIQNISIRSKLILIQFVTSTIVLAICLTVFAIADINNYKDTRVRSLLSMAQVLGSNSISSLDFLDNAAANQILGELRFDPNIISAAIFDKNGKIFATYTRSGFPVFYFSFKEAGIMNYKIQDKQLFVYDRIVKDGNTIGFVCLKAELKQINYFIKQKILIALLGMIVGLGVFYLIAVLLNKYIAGPVMDLERIIREINSSGNYKRQVPVNGEDEIGVLSAAFNGMMELIDKTDKELLSNNNLLNSILQCIGDGVLVVDKDGKVLIWNHAGEKIAGKRSTDISVYKWPEMYGAFRSDGVTPLKAEELPVIRATKGESVTNFEILFSNSDKKDAIASYTARPLRNFSGEIIGGVAVFRDVTNRKKIEDELNATKQQFQDIMDNSSAIIFTKQLDGKYLFINRQYEKYLNISRSRVIGKRDLDLWSKEISDKISFKDSEVIEYGQSVTYEESFFLEGELFTYVVLKFPLVNAHGSIYALSCMATDITHRKRAERELENSLSLLKATLEATADGILVVDMDGKIVEFNKRFVEMWHIPDSVLNLKDDRKALAFVSDQLKDPVGFINKVKELTSLPHCESFDVIEFIDGRTIERCSKPQYLKDEVIGRVYSFHDVTQMKRAEEEVRNLNADLERRIQERTIQLASSEEKFRALVQSAYDAIISINSNGEIIYWNEAAEKIFGYSNEEVMERTLAFIMPDKYKEAHVQGMQRYLATGEAHLIGKGPIELVGLKKGNIEFPIELSLQSWRTSEGVFFTAMLRDITKRKKTEYEIRQLYINLEDKVKERTVELERSNKALEKAKVLAEQSKAAKETFLASMSHEIRTPLNSILGFLQLLKDSQLNQEQKEFVESIDFAGKNLLVIINDILDYSKIEAGRFDFNESEFSIEDVCGSVVELIGARAREKNIPVYFNHDNKLPDFSIGDSARLSQILLNLLGNAVKFTERGRVQLITHFIKETQSEIWCEFLVEDTGIGIAEEKLARIFDRFTETTKDTSKKFGGTGLGLAISKKLVELQGGTIDVKSWIGKGSVFSFCLGFKKTNRKKEDGGKKAFAESYAFEVPRHLKILLAEDIELNQRLARKIFKKTDHELVVVSNGKEAIDQVKKDDFDLILMDIQMPEMDGYEATACIRKMEDENKRKIPIVALSAYVPTGEEDKYIKMGMNGYVTKPFTQKELFDAIGRVIKDGGNGKGYKKTESKGVKPLYDLGYIKSTSDNDPSFIKDMILLYLNNLPDRIKDLKNAIENKDFDKIVYSAHKIKNLAIPFQMNEALDLSQKVEEEAREGKNKSLIETISGKLIQLLEQSIEPLRKELNDLK